MNSWVVGSFTGRIQANGEMDWTTIGTGTAMEIPTNGYLAVFLTNKSVHPVYFDDLRIRLTKGILKEENHYYPHGLPMARIGGTAVGETENRQKHQSNEYIKDAGLNWMDFSFRQYDPQIGRFLGVDPLADYYGQDRFSPYAAMGNQPEGTVDPHGLAIDAGSGGAEFEARWNRMKGFYTSSVSAEIWNSMSWAQRFAFIDAYGQGDIPGMMSFMAFRAIGLGSPGGGGNRPEKEEEEGAVNTGSSYLSRFVIGSLMLMRAEAALVSGAGSGQASVDDPGEKYPGGYKPVQVTDADGTTRTEYQLVSEDEYVSSLKPKRSFWKDFWYGAAGRLAVPDVFTVSMGGDLAWIVGVGAQPINITFLTRGKAPGIYLTPTFNTNAGVTVKAEGSLNFTSGLYTGDPYNISPDMLPGVNQGVNFSLKVLGGVAIGRSTSEIDKYVYRFINYNANVGVGAGFSVEYQRQYTPGYGTLWEW